MQKGTIQHFYQNWVSARFHISFMKSLTCGNIVAVFLFQS